MKMKAKHRTQLKRESFGIFTLETEDKSIGSALTYIKKI